VTIVEGSCIPSCLFAFASCASDRGSSLGAVFSGAGADTRVRRTKNGRIVLTRTVCVL